MNPYKFGKKEFTLVTEEKIDRVINGTVGQAGQLVGGLGRDADDEDVIAHYDKNAGLILDSDGRELETGCFWNFREGKPRKKPVIEYKEGAKSTEVVTNETDDTLTKDSKVDITDAAKELAEEEGFDINKIQGTGAGGRILVSDVKSLIEENEE